VFDNVTITYRGATYEIGRGWGFYGVWTAGGPRSRPLERWPETPEGWTAAWTRFVSIEAPDTIVPVGQNTPPVGGGALGEGGEPGPFGANAVLTPAGAALSGKASRVMAAALLGVGVILGIAGLFPAYIGGASLAQQPDQVTPHAIYLAVWAASTVLILLGGTRLRVGMLLSVGLSAVTFGLFFADAGTAISAAGSSGGAGLVLSLIGWVACAAGTVVAVLPGLGSRFRAAAPASRPGAFARPRGSALGPVVLVILAGLGAAAAFAPSWDSFTLRTAAGQVQTVTAGNAFSNPGLVITGDVVVMIAFAAAVIAAALWRPARYGAVLLAGATIPMVAQAISAFVQVGEAHGPAQFGIPPATARQLGITISAGLTPAFWIYFGFLIALVVSCVWMLSTPQPVPVTPAEATPAPATPAPATPDAATPAPATPAPATPDAVTPDTGPEASHAAAADHAAAGARDGDGPG
jgi:cell division septation protein DedD